MAQANPGQTLSNASVAGAGTAIDLTGASTGVAVPTTVAMVVKVTNWAETYDQSKIAAHGAVVIGLEVSMDNSTFIRVGSVGVTSNGTFRTLAVFPCRYARATVDTLDTRVSLTMDAYVAGGQLGHHDRMSHAEEHQV